MIDCSIEHLVDIIFKDVYGLLMYILQYSNFKLVKAIVFRVYSISDTDLSILSSKISKGNRSSEVVVNQHF